MSLDDDIRRLSAIPTLGVLGTEALRLIAFSAETRTVRSGDVLFRRGEESDGGFVVLNGSIGLERAPEQEERVVGPGVLIGERALLANLRRATTATARSDATVLKISRRLFYRVLTEFPGSAERVRASLIGDLARRLRG